jgi:hypothetical protein
VYLTNIQQHGAALTPLLELSKSFDWRLRRRTAYALKHFCDAEVKAALEQLRQGGDPRVVEATA